MPPNPDFPPALGSSDRALNHEPEAVWREREAMRPSVQHQIDALHAQIAALVAEEKAHHRTTHPHLNFLWREVADSSIDVAAWPPELRKQARIEGTLQYRGAR
ncbi:hypothetical protein [Methylibium petroleiphilum]